MSTGSNLGYMMHFMTKVVDVDLPTWEPVNASYT